MKPKKERMIDKILKCFPKVQKFANTWPAERERERERRQRDDREQTNTPI